MSDGFLYIIGGRNIFFEEAYRSIRSLRKVNPKANVTVFADRNDKNINRIVNRFEIKPMDCTNRMYDGKINHIFETPYKRTVFLDSDTQVLGFLGPLFEILKFYDMALTQAPGVKKPTRDQDENLIEALIPYNCGMIAFNKNNKIERLFKEWKNLFYSQTPGEGFMKDYKNKVREQPAFSLAAMKSDARIYTLNHCWNARARGPLHLIGRVKILHGRFGDRDRKIIIRQINRHPNPRVWDWNKFKIHKKNAALSSNQI